MFFQTHLSPEIGSFEVTSQGVLQCLNETEVVHGLPGSRGSRAGRQAPCAALPTGKAENDTRQHPLHPPTCPAQRRGAVRGEEERGERKRGASTVGEGLESS